MPVLNLFGPTNSDIKHTWHLYNHSIQLGNFHVLKGHFPALFKNLASPYCEKALSADLTLIYGDHKFCMTVHLVRLDGPMKHFLCIPSHLTIATCVTTHSSFHLYQLYDLMMTQHRIIAMSLSISSDLTKNNLSQDHRSFSNCSRYYDKPFIVVSGKMIIQET